MSTNRPAVLTDARRGYKVLAGLIMIFVIPAVYLLVRIAIGENRFDGLSLLILVIVGRGGYFVYDNTPRKTN